MNLKKEMIWPTVASLAVGLYTTFVLQRLWNWFVASAFHIPEIGYWHMCGLTIFASILFDKSQNFSDDADQEMLRTLVLACVPNDRQDALSADIEERTQGIWVKMTTHMFGKLAGNTFTLVLGWIIHSILV